MIKNKGFTLAEVLITLAIIGIVAAMTIPTLISDYQDRVNVTKMKKMFSALTNAYGLYLTEQGPIGRLEKTEDDAIKAFEVFKPYLKVARDCGTDNGEDCVYSGSYKLRNGDDKDSEGTPWLPYTDSMYYKVILADGASIWFRGSGSDKFDIDIFYDVNGKNGPNQWGHDLFEFMVKDETVYPNGIPGTQTEKFDTGCAPSDSKGYGCAAWVIYKGNFEYLKCDDLEWNGKNKCD